MRKLLVLMCLGALAGCSGLGSRAEAPVPAAAPAMAWDHRPEASEWTLSTMNALEGPGAGLAALVPSDIAAWCPGYPEASVSERRAVWSGLFSALAKHESTWNPAAVGGGGRWFGLVQISPRTAAYHGCAVTSGQALKDGEANLRCAVRIAANQVPKRGSVARGMRDWGPFHHESKRAEMSAWTRSQSYCRG